MRVSLQAAAIGCAMLVLGTLPAAVAADQEDSEVLAKYDRTQTFENCIRISRIESSRILNRHQILFEMAGGKTYLNEPDSCPSLSKSLTLVFDATIDELCTTTIVRLVDTGAGVGERGSCGLAKFQELTKKPATN